MRSTIARILALALVVLAAACSIPREFAAGPKPPVPGTAVVAPKTSFRVGTARVDLTPGPGSATWGHGPDSLISTGYWTRLECRVFFFQTADARPLALVPCDLQSPSHYLQRLVTEKVAAIVPGSRIFISATHTHAGVAHYWEGDAYGGAGSSRYPGFDSAMVDFLATRISDGIKAAAGGAEPAKLRVLHQDVWEISRNRSIDAYHMNGEAAWKPEPPSPLTGEAEDHRLIDPALDVLDIEPLDGPPHPHGATGAIAFFAMHPTVLSPLNHVFNADVFGITSRAVERELRRSLALRHPKLDFASVDPIAAVINGNEGDLVPRYEEDAHEEVIRVGTALGNHVIELLGNATEPYRDTMTIDARFLEIDMARAWIDGTKLCEAVLGQATQRGASDHRAATEYLLSDAPDTESDTGACDAPKAKGLGILQDIIAPPSAYPHFVSLGLVRFDDALVAFVPAELTMTAGHEIDAAITQEWTALVGTPKMVRIGGLTNAYIQYVATPAEYQLQAYEGASTLYGPKTLALFVDRFRRLARSLGGRDTLNHFGTYVIDEIPKIELDTATQRPRFPRPSFNASLADLDARGARKRTAFCTLPHAPNESPALCMQWNDGGPGTVPITAAPWISLRGATGAVSICGAPYGKTLVPSGCDPRGTLDDWGTELVVHTTGEACPSNGKSDGSWSWIAILRPRSSDWASLAGSAGLYLHVATDPGRAAIDSTVFTAERLPPQCTERETRACVKETPIECAP